MIVAERAATGSYDFGEEPAILPMTLLILEGAPQPSHILQRFAMLLPQHRR
jgi:hypothetical protein